MKKRIIGENKGLYTPANGAPLGHIGDIPVAQKEAMLLDEAIRLANDISKQSEFQHEFTIAYKSVYGSLQKLNGDSPYGDEIKSMFVVEEHAFIVSARDVFKRELEKAGSMEELKKQLKADSMIHVAVHMFNLVLKELVS